MDIYEYQPSMMHAKVVVVDDQWVSLGSANFDQRSFFHNDELTISAAEPKLSKQIDQFFTQAFDNSHQVHLDNWRRRSLRQQAIGRFGLLFQRQL